jgi:chromosomal replication initiator protein
MQHDLIGRVAALFELTRAELISASRKRHIVEARQAAAWVLRHAYPRISLQTIGEQIGGRDHTTVIYAIARTTERMRADPQLDTQLRAMIDDPPPLPQRRRVDTAMHWWATQGRDTWLVAAA